MPSYEVVYFNGRGLAETTRMMLAFAGQDFKDTRHTSEEWAKIKEETPMKQLPILKVDGCAIPQSRAMHAYVAREFGLNGQNNTETTKIDVIIATVEDIRTPLARLMFYEKDEEKKKEGLANFYANTAPKFLAELEKMLEKGDGYFVGSKISRADIFFFSTFEKFNRECLEKFPKLVDLLDRVAKEPKIAAWLEKRPETNF
jgi:glutathione S-transferase